MSNNTEQSGGTRFSGGKPGSYYTMPLLGLRLVSDVTKFGASKYAPMDWAEGQSFSTLMDSAFRHMLEALTHGPWALDSDADEKGHRVYHLAAVAWNVLCLLHFMEQGRVDLDDVTPFHGVVTSDLRQAKALAGGPGSVVELLRNAHEVMHNSPIEISMMEAIQEAFRSEAGHP